MCFYEHNLLLSFDSSMYTPDILALHSEVISIYSDVFLEKKKFILNDYE